MSRVLVIGVPDSRKTPVITVAANLRMLLFLHLAVHDSCK